MKKQIAYFISSHGFGHAARSAAIMESLQSINDRVEFNIFTRVPEWFFANSKTINYKFHDIPTDIGLVQKTALQEDINETIKKLNDYYPLSGVLIKKVSDVIRRLDSILVICDISPLGLAAASASGVESVLVENFTWDWIYDKYKLKSKFLNSHIDYLRDIYSNADYRIKTQPICYESKCNITTFPVSRKPKLSKIQMRKILNLDQSRSLAMITMGGINTRYDFIDKLNKFDEIDFIVPGISDKFTKINNIILTPHNSELYHPDIVNASDAVIGKLGYSTLAEVYNAGKPFGYIARDMFPESVPLEKYIQINMKGIKINSHQFESNRWMDKIEELVSFRGISHNHVNGSDQAADFINDLIV